MLFSILDTINMGINSDHHQSIYSFFKTPKIVLTSKHLIFMVTNYLRTRSFKELEQLFEQGFQDRVSPTKMTNEKMLKRTRLKDQA